MTTSLTIPALEAACFKAYELIKALEIPESGKNMLRSELGYLILPPRTDSREDFLGLAPMPHTFEELSDKLKQFTRQTADRIPRLHPEDLDRMFAGKFRAVIVQMEGLAKAALEAAAASQDVKASAFDSPRR